MDEEEDLFGSSDGEEEKDKSLTEDKKHILQKELRLMMYGFGDDKAPYDRTVDTLEAITLYYIKVLCQAAMKVGKAERLALEDIHYLIRRDAKKFARVKDLLSISEELKKARKQFEEVKPIIL